MGFPLPCREWLTYSLPLYSPAEKKVCFNSKHFNATEKKELRDKLSPILGSRSAKVDTNLILMDNLMLYGQIISWAMKHNITIMFIPCTPPPLLFDKQGRGRPGKQSNQYFLAPVRRPHGVYDQTLAPKTSLRRCFCFCKVDYTYFIYGNTKKNVTEIKSYFIYFISGIASNHIFCCSMQQSWTFYIYIYKYLCVPV